MKINILIKLTPLLMIALLSGCTDSNVSLVQNGQGDYAKALNGHTFGDVLNNRKNCDDTQWVSEKDKNNNVTVTYTCFYDDIDDFFSDGKETITFDINYNNKVSITEFQSTIIQNDKPVVKTNYGMDLIFSMAIILSREDNTFSPKGYVQSIGFR